MADEYLLVFWTSLAVLFGLFYLWKRRKVQQQLNFIEDQKRSLNLTKKNPRLDRVVQTKAKTQSKTETGSRAAEAYKVTESSENLALNLSKEDSGQSKSKSARLSHVRSKEDVKKARLKRFEEPGQLREAEKENHHNLAETGKQTPDKDNQAQSEKFHDGESESLANNTKEITDGLNNKEKELCTTKRIAPPGKSDTAGREGIMFDPKTGAPISHPLKTLEEALAWRPGFDEFNIARVPLNISEALPVCTGQVKTLVCHDMRGGYIEDRFVQGYPSWPCYAIYHWQYIDIFVYFSHHFVTIPPPCWTNAAHTHAVPVLGTLITEWEDGSERCAKIFQDQTSFEQFANQLVNIAEYYKFDGWLVNIENPIQPAQVNNMAEFVKYLTNTMHRKIPNSLVIWYDSVTYKGDLKWQDELNANNRIFFDACDGIFLNYNWTEGHLMRSASSAGRHLQSRVYVGVDCFGRGCYGGGGFNCNKAFKVIRNENLSAALFAPGWVMENLGKEHFIAHQDKFWNLLSGFCNVHCSVTKIPFVTSFCRGYGEKVYCDGKVVLSCPWTNLSAQQPQPTYSNTFFNLGSKGGLVIKKVDHTLRDAYNGGGCLLVEGQLQPNAEVSKGVVRLYKTDICVLSPLLISLTFKLDNKKGLDVALQLHRDKKPTYLLLCPPPPSTEDIEREGEQGLLNQRILQRYGIHKSSVLRSSVFTSPIGGEHYEAYAPLSGDDHVIVQKAFTCGDDLSDGWCTRHYLIAGKHLSGSRILEIRLLCATCSTDSSVQEMSDDTFNLFNGEIKILDPQVIKLAVNPVENLRSRDVEWTTADQQHVLTVTLSWDCPVIEGHEEPVAYYNVFQKELDGHRFIGRAFVEAYRVCQLRVPDFCSHVEFIVQTVTRSGLKRPLETCSSIKLKWG